MSLDNIQLAPVIMHNLYKDMLYDLNTHKSGFTAIQEDKIQFLGNNEKKVAVLVLSAEFMYLPEHELNFLLGILQACKLSMADVALVNLSKNPALTYRELTSLLKAEKVIAFGPDAAQLDLPVQFPQYQVQHYNNQVYLTSAPLAQLQKDKNEKLQLWNCLKKMFSL